MKDSAVTEIPTTTAWLLASSSQHPGGARPAVSESICQGLAGEGPFAAGPAPECEMLGMFLLLVR